MKQTLLIITLGLNLLWSSSDDGELLMKLKTDSENRSDSVPFTVNYHPSGTVRNINGKLSGTIGNNFAAEALQFLDDHKTLFGIDPSGEPGGWFSYAKDLTVFNPYISFGLGIMFAEDINSSGRPALKDFFPFPVLSITYEFGK